MRKRSNLNSCFFACAMFDVWNGIRNRPSFLKVVDENYSMRIPINNSHNLPSRLFCFRSLWCTFTRFNPLFWPFTLFWSKVVDPCFIHRHKSTQKRFQIAVKIGQIMVRSGHTNAFLVDCEQSWHPSCTEFSHAPMCMKNIEHTLSWDGYELNYLTHFHFRVILK